jgi:hypothetical protein
MAKFQMVAMSMILALGFMTGCPDGDDDYDADADMDSDSDAGSDADADAGAEIDTTSDEMSDETNSEDSATTCEGWFDPTTSLCWQNPDSGNTYTWADAVAYCENLSLGGHEPGTWHLPTISELRSLIRGCPGTETTGSCGVTDTCWDWACCPTPCAESPCNGCSAFAGPGSGGCYWDSALGGTTGSYGSYWSSSRTTGTASAWYVLFGLGQVTSTNLTVPGYVRCVRRGP